LYILVYPKKVMYFLPKRGMEQSWMQDICLKKRGFPAKKCTDRQPNLTVECIRSVHNLYYVDILSKFLFILSKNHRRTAKLTTKVNTQYQQNLSFFPKKKRERHENQIQSFSSLIQFEISSFSSSTLKQIFEKCIEFHFLWVSCGSKKKCYIHTCNIRFYCGTWATEYLMKNFLFLCVFSHALWKVLQLINFIGTDKKRENQFYLLLVLLGVCELFMKNKKNFYSFVLFFMRYWNADKHTLFYNSIQQILAFCCSWDLWGFSAFCLVLCTCLLRKSISSL